MNEWVKLSALSPRAQALCNSDFRVPLFGIHQTVEERGPALTTSIRDFSIFEESPAATALSLKELVPPPIIMFAPPGGRFIHAYGEPRSRWVNIQPSDGPVVSSQLLAMRAAGRRPYFDFNHEGGGESGYPEDIYWRPQTGLAAIVDWTPEASAGILSGKFKHFSNQTVTQGADILGIGLCCGTLSSGGSAFGEHFCRVSPITRAKALSDLSTEFLYRVDACARELRAAGAEEDSVLVRACDELKTRWPMLHEAYELKAALRRELGHDWKLRHA